MARLFSSDFRAPERLFALLMQAAGRAGRRRLHGGPGHTVRNVGFQTFHPPARRVQSAAQA